MPNSHDLTPARCLTCGYEWKVVPASIYVGTGCPRCAGRTVTWAEWDARAAAVGIEWLGEISNSTTKVPARCLGCGYEWQVASDKVQGGQGCPQCAVYGFDPADPSIVYLIAIPDQGIMTIGVLNAGGDRIAKHRSRGWELVRTWATDDGHQALDLGAAVLSWWRDQGATFATRDEVPAGDGFTESVHVGVVDITSTMAYVERLRAALAVQGSITPGRARNRPDGRWWPAVGA